MLMSWTRAVNMHLDVLDLTNCSITDNGTFFSMDFLVLFEKKHFFEGMKALLKHLHWQQLGIHEIYLCHNKISATGFITVRDAGQNAKFSLALSILATCWSNPCFQLEVKFLESVISFNQLSKSFANSSTAADMLCSTSIMFPANIYAGELTSFFSKSTSTPDTSWFTWTAPKFSMSADVFSSRPIVSLVPPPNFYPSQWLSGKMV